MFRNILICALLVGWSFAAHAADTNNDGVETILLPLAFRSNVTIFGAFGTQWRGEVWLRNESSLPVYLQRAVGCTFNECSAQYPQLFTGRIDDPLQGNADGGLLLTPSAADARFLFFSNRMFEVTRHAQPQGIELPVIREGQFLKSSSLLIGAPTSDAVRVAIRLYDPRRISGNSIKVEVLGPDAAILGSTTLTTTVPAASFGDLLRPGFIAIYDLAAVFPVVKSVPYVHIRVTPLTANAEYWAMASVTDNDTQQVLLITPQ